MMKKIILVTMLLFVTAGLTACRNNDNDNGYVVTESEVSYEREETDIVSDELNESNQRPENTEISLEQAIQIAYEDLENRGISATFREESGMEWERGQWVWELLFTTEGENMPFIEYYISVDDGSIVKFEWDD